MKIARLACLIACGCSLFMILATGSPYRSAGASAGDATPVSASSNSWYFAVSGDSRDCGDLIMPKIASAIAAKRKEMPVKFYWHLGDFRALYRVDCDIAKRTEPRRKCALESTTDELKPTPDYLKAAWPDFIEHQVQPFEQAGIPIYLGIGNHETIGRGRDEFRSAFRKWLTQPAITKQRAKDTKRKIASLEGDTYFHFVMQGVDFIYLDNSNIYNSDPPTKKPDPGFSADQLKWLEEILKADEADESVKGVVVGMHAALPESVSKSHAMDKTCESFCNGKRAYAMLEHVQAKGKQVLVLASHSHYVEPNAYGTPEHSGHVLAGWIVGTAGAEQYRLDIKYGYLLVEIKTDGTMSASFQQVTRESPPLVPGEAGAQITNYCFEKNKRLPDPNEKHVTAKDCSCALH
jgi:Calcineurin-like phosphoesterase